MTALLNPTAALLKMLIYAFGRICAKMIRPALSPTNFALCTNCMPLRRSISLRAILAKLGIKRMPNAMMTLNSPFPKKLTKTRAKRMLGKALTTSLIRMTTSSSQPPLYPAVNPMIVPMTHPKAMVESATRNVVPAPCITRLKMSRP